MKIQKDIIKMVTGTHPALQVCEKAYIDRRKQCWTAWVDGHGNGSITATLYRSHLPYIVVFFKHVWDVDLPSDISMDNAQELSSTVLEEVKNEIVDLLVKMFIIGVVSLYNILFDILSPGLLPIAEATYKLSTPTLPQKEPIIT